MPDATLTLYIDESGHFHRQRDLSWPAGVRVLAGLLLQGAQAEHQPALERGILAGLPPEACWRNGPLHAKDLANAVKLAVRLRRARPGEVPPDWEPLARKLRAAPSLELAVRDEFRRLNTEAERLVRCWFRLAGELCRSLDGVVVLAAEHDLVGHHEARYTPMASALVERVLLALASREVVLQVVVEHGGGTLPPWEPLRAFAARVAPGVVLPAPQLRTKGPAGLQLADAFAFGLGARSEELLPLSGQRARSDWSQGAVQGRLRDRFGAGLTLWLADALHARDQLWAVLGEQRSLAEARQGLDALAVHLPSGCLLGPLQEARQLLDSLRRSA